MDKAEVLKRVREKIAQELEAAIAAQKAAHEAATHEEARPENDKDTRGLEQSYLARGLAERVLALKDAKSALLSVSSRAQDKVTLGALVRVVDEDDNEAVYLIAPAAGGLAVDIDDERVKVVSPSAPIAKALLNKEKGDEAVVRTQTARAGNERVLEVLEVS